jgi:hypothetical protein
MICIATVGLVIATGVFVIHPEHGLPTVTVQPSPCASPDAKNAGSVSGQPTYGCVRVPDYCNDVYGQTSHFNLSESGCLLEANVSWTENSNDWSEPTYAFSLGLWGLAEVDAAGQMVEFSNLAFQVAASTSVVSSAQFVNVTINETQIVTKASGPWDPENLWSWGANQTGGSLGTVEVQVVFHLSTSSYVTGGLTNGLKFDVDVSGWPWANVNDHLGLELDALAPAGYEYSWNPVTQNLTQSMTTGVSHTAALELGGSASTFGSNPGASSAAVTSSAGIYTLGTPQREALVLMDFTGGHPGYSALHYDPWIVFSSANAGAPSLVGSSMGSSSLLSVVVVGVFAAAVLIAVVLVTRARKSVSVEAQMRAGPRPAQPVAPPSTFPGPAKEEDPLDHLL